MSKVLKYAKKTETGMSFQEFRLTDDEAFRIMQVVTGARRPMQIDFRGNLLRTSMIEIFDEAEAMQIARQQDGKLDLNDPLQKAEVIAFEAKLQYQKSWVSQIHGLEWYGYPLKARGEGWVINPLLGVAHWSTVAYAIKENAIRRKPNGSWSVLAETLESRIGGKVETKAYDEIKRLVDGLNALESRRRFATANETGPVDSMAPMGI